jgi:predicted NUDIX family NTP pyrophosphohydrolase
MAASPPNRTASVAQISAGILLYRLTGPEPEVLLVHPGGPFWAKKDDGAWSIPKGLCEADEDPLVAARREFNEETGGDATGEAVDLGSFRQPGGKVIRAFAIEGDFDPATIRSNLFAMEWPPRSGRRMEFPEVDRAGWFGAGEARRKALKGQIPLINALFDRLHP